MPNRRTNENLATSKAILGVHLFHKRNDVVVAFSRIPTRLFSKLERVRYSELPIIGFMRVYSTRNTTTEWTNNGYVLRENEIIVGGGTSATTKKQLSFERFVKTSLSDERRI